MSLIITGASGQFARLVTRTLCENTPASELILVSRNPDSLADLAAQGKQVRYGDFDNAASLEAAFAGGERMLLISTLSVGRRADQHRRAIHAAAKAGVKHIVYTSSGGARPDNPAIVIPDHLATEAALRTSGLAYTVLRDSLYAEAVVLEIAPRMLAVGQWSSAAGEGRSPFVWKADCAAVAAKVLTTAGHENRTYELTGPALVSFRDAASLTAEICGRPLPFVPITDEQLTAALAAAGVPHKYIERMNTPGVGTSSIEDIVSYEQGLRGGFFEVLSTDVHTILGRPPRSLRDLFQENARLLRGAAPVH